MINVFLVMKSVELLPQHIGAFVLFVVHVMKLTLQQVGV
jgi:hypothetical protein